MSEVSLAEFQVLCCKLKDFMFLYKEDYYILMHQMEILIGTTEFLVLWSKSKGLPRQAEVAQGAPGRLRPRIFLTFRHYKGGRSSAKSTGRLYPRINPWYSLSEAESTSGHVVLSGVPRIPSDTTGNLSRDLPTSSATP